MAARTLEILTARAPSPTAQPILEGIRKAAVKAGDRVTLSMHYKKGSDWLCLWGVGATAHDVARRKQVAKGGHALLWDLGYFRRKKVSGYVRMSIDTDHCQQWLDRTEPDPSRWESLGIELREDYREGGPIILVGLGRKSRSYLGVGEHWEKQQLEIIRKKYPGRTVIHRPKPGNECEKLDCERDENTPIEKLLRGASLVVTRHSNVGVDAVVAGVPFEASDGAASWLNGKDYSPANRLDFLRRLAHFQYLPDEAKLAWKFAKGIV